MTLKLHLKFVINLFTINDKYINYIYRQLSKEKKKKENKIPVKSTGFHVCAPMLLQAALMIQSCAA